MKSFRLKIVIPLAAFICILWVFRAPVENQVLELAILRNKAPEPEVVAEMIQRAGNPRATLLTVWNSGGIVHREVAMSVLRGIFPDNQPLPPEINSMLLAAALDADVNVRETAFSILRARHHPAWLALAAAQLRDVDQSVRLLGLDQFKYAPAPVAVPLVAALLNDPDTAVAGLSVKYLEHWSGERFGMKLADTVQREDKTTGLEEFSDEGVVKTKAAAEKASAWWLGHQGQFPAVQLTLPSGVADARVLVPAGNFQLRALDGKEISLADFRGKVVLLNFWTTWCPSCVGEMPELIALQKQHVDHLVIIGVSLDYVPDEDGTVGGDAAGQKLDPSDRPAAAALLAKIRAHVARTVSQRGINYPILLDENDEVGGQFNGGELPTTVIIDSQGNIRRRFVGTRSLSVFDAMIREAAQDLPPVQIATSRP